MPRRENRPRFGRNIRIGFAVLLLCSGSAHVFAEEGKDSRSTEILSYACGSEFSRRDITLFANGTVRLREGPWDDQELYLDELTPEAVEDNLRLLESIDADRIDRIRAPMEDGLTGRWIERCRLRLDLPDQVEPIEYELSSLDVPPLAISRLIHIAEELAQYVRPAAKEPAGLPADYEPRFGDVLRTAEGLRFEVLRLTSDRRGVELQGIDQPLRIYVALSEISEAFVALEQHRDDAFWWRR